MAGGAGGTSASQASERTGVCRRSGKLVSFSEVLGRPRARGQASERAPAWWLWCVRSARVFASTLTHTRQDGGGALILFCSPTSNRQPAPNQSEACICLAGGSLYIPLPPLHNISRVERQSFDRKNLFSTRQLNLNNSTKQQQQRHNNLTHGSCHRRSTISPV